jgi:hypothetical protein
MGVFWKQFRDIGLIVLCHRSSALRVRAADEGGGRHPRADRIVRALPLMNGETAPAAVDRLSPKSSPRWRFASLQAHFTLIQPVDRPER